MTLRIKRSLASATCLATGVFAVMPSAVSAKTEISPYIEVSQVLSADLKGSNDVLTYTSVAAGVETTIGNERTQAQLSYRYEHQFGWGANQDDSDVHSGLARVNHKLINNVLSIDAGALATRTRGDIRGPSPTIITAGNAENVSQVYSAYIGPTVSTRAGPLEVNAAYRLGYSKVSGNDFVPAAGQPRLDSYDDSLSHTATASVGMSPDQLPFGWKVSGIYEREDAGQLDQRYESMGVRGDVVVPVSGSIALLGGVGYENIETSERPPVLDATGNPVLNSKGRYVTNTASPRLISYDFDGIYWDAGVGWKPSRRTNLELHVGRRYGSMSYTGSFAWQPSANSSLQFDVYDQVETFGQELTDTLAGMPTNFGTSRNPLGNQFGGCVFSGGSNSNAGGCFNQAFQSVNTAAYRSRGVNAQYSAGHGPLSVGVGAGYSQRSFKTPNAPGVSTLLGVKDQSYFGQGNIAYQLDRQSSIDAAVFANLFNSGIVGAPNVLSTGATSSYNRQFGRKLSATAAVGLYSFDIDGQEADLNAQALVGMRYSF